MTKQPRLCALLLVGIANQLITVDRVRAWEIIGEAVKEANRLEGYAGENTIHFPMMTGNEVRFQTIGGENFSLANILRALAKDDLYRALDVAKSLKIPSATCHRDARHCQLDLRQDYKMTELTR